MRRAFSSSIYLRFGSKILLVHHKRFNQWVPVGGELEKGETPLDAAQRELLEETGIRNAVFPNVSHNTDLPDPPNGFLTYEEHDAKDKGLHMNFAFVALSPTESVVLCSEHKEFGWFSHDELQKLDTPLNVLRIAYRALYVFDSTQF